MTWWRTFAQFVPRGPPALIDTVGDATKLLREVVHLHLTRLAHGRDRPNIAMAAGLTERQSADPQSRPNQQAVIDRIGQSTIGTGRITHGRKTAHQHALHDLRGLCQQVTDRFAHQLGEIKFTGFDMHVRVNQARHQRSPGKIDFPPAFAGYLERFVGDVLYAIAVDQYIKAFAQLIAGGIDKCSIAKQYTRQNQLLRSRTFSPRRAAEPNGPDAGLSLTEFA